MTLIKSTLAVLLLIFGLSDFQTFGQSNQDQLHISTGFALPQNQQSLSFELGFVPPGGWPLKGGRGVIGLNSLIGTTFGDRSFQYILVGPRLRLPITQDLFSETDFRVGTYGPGMLISMSTKVAYKRAFVAVDAFHNPRRSLQTGVRVGWIFMLPDW